jgi:hypothetical protein
MLGSGAGFPQPARRVVGGTCRYVGRCRLGSRPPPAAAQALTAAPTSATLRGAVGRSGTAPQAPGQQALALSGRPLRRLCLSAAGRGGQLAGWLAQPRRLCLSAAAGCGQLAGWQAQPLRATRRRNCLFFNRLIDCIAPATFTHTPRNRPPPPCPLRRLWERATSANWPLPRQAARAGGERAGRRRVRWRCAGRRRPPGPRRRSGLVPRAASRQTPAPARRGGRRRP